jgi:DegV family protein with EDD domain
MTSTCIVTDSSAQFSKASFHGQKLVHIVPLETLLKENGLLKKASVNELPQIIEDHSKITISAPTIEQLRILFLELSQAYDNIFGIFLSNQLSTCFKNAEEASHTLLGKVNVVLMDSQTTSAGLGQFVQIAAEQITKGMSIIDVERLIRSLMPISYSLICTPNTTYLSANNLLDNTQALISDMLGLYPIFTLEEGILAPLEKVRSPRHAISFFQEFLDEFDNLRHIVFVQGSQMNFKEAKLFYENTRELFPSSPMVKTLINLPVAGLFGPKTMGLFIMEKRGSESFD